MKKMLCIVAIAIFSFTAVSAQDYNWAVGVRGGGFGGLTAKHKINSKDALDFTVDMPFMYSGVVVTALYERHMNVINKDFHFYYGAGLHVGGWKNSLGLGIDGVAGLEYKIPKVPLAVSADYRPMINLVESFGFWPYNFGVGLKYTF